MTSTPDSAPLCGRCGLQPPARQLNTVTDPPVVLQLCDPCFVDEIRRRLEAAYQQWGGELEIAFREAGTPLPEEVSGEQVVRGLFEDMQRRADTPEFRARVEPIRQAMNRFAEEVAAELPGGADHPEFGEQLLARMRTWMEKHPPPDAEASA